MAFKQTLMTGAPMDSQNFLPSNFPSAHVTPLNPSSHQDQTVDSDLKPKLYKLNSYKLLRTLSSDRPANPNAVLAKKRFMHHTPMPRRTEPSPSMAPFQCWRLSESKNAEEPRKLQKVSPRRTSSAPPTTAKVVFKPETNALPSRSALSKPTFNQLAMEAMVANTAELLPNEKVKV